MEIPKSEPLHAMFSGSIKFRFTYCHYLFKLSYYYSFIHSFIPAISIAPHQVHNYSEALPTTALRRSELRRRSATGHY